MTTTKPARPLPYRGVYDDVFWGYTKKRELRLQRCSGCGKFRWPPGPVCDQCLSLDYSWEAVSGEGRVLSWVVFHRQYFPGIPTPYNCIMVELKEGPLFISNLEGMKDEDIRMDLPVRVDFVDQPEGYTLPVFRPMA